MTTPTMVRCHLAGGRCGGPVLAVSVALTSTLGEFELGNEADEIVCLEDYEPFGWFGLYYHNFRQIGDQEVTNIISRFAAEPSLQAWRR